MQKHMPNTPTSFTDWLSSPEVSAEAIAKELKVRPGNVYMWGWKNAVPKKYISKLRKLGFETPEMPVEIRVTTTPIPGDVLNASLEDMVKKARSIEFQFMLVTPEQAAKWLGNNKSNRKLHRKNSLRLQRMMEDDKFYPTPDGPLCLSPEGVLLNGQHRLQAIVNSGKSVWLFVALDVPSELQPMIDKAMVRSVADNLEMFYELPKKYARKVPAVTRYLTAFETGVWEKPLEDDCLATWNKFKKSITWFFNDAPDSEWNRGVYYSAPLIWAHHYDENLAETFHNELVGTAAQVESTALALLARTLGSKALRTGGSHGFQMSLRILSTMKSYETNQKITSIRLSTSGLDYLNKIFGRVSFEAGTCSHKSCPNHTTEKSDYCWVHNRFRKIGGKATGV